MFLCMVTCCTRARATHKVFEWGKGFCSGLKLSLWTLPRDRKRRFRLLPLLAFILHRGWLYCNNQNIIVEGGESSLSPTVFVFMLVTVAFCRQATTKEGTCNYYPWKDRARMHSVTIDVGKMYQRFSSELKPPACLNQRRSKGNPYPPKAPIYLRLRVV